MEHTQLVKSGPPMVVIVGETASGKSALAMALAEKFDGELICADSWTVYRGFEIGTAKPSASEQARVPHHMLDVADPIRGFSAVEFQKQARAAIADIQSRGKLPIMVGGTGLYIDSILYEYQFLPPPAVGLRQELSALTLQELQGRAEAAGLDTTGIDLRNKRRIIRLIENNGIRPSKGDMRTSTLVLGIATDRVQLRERITQRVDAMLSAGLQDEVRQLSERYGWDAEPMKGIGYREWQLFFEADQSLEVTRERIIAASMGLAKRQRTWFKRNDHIQWLPITTNMSTKIDTTAQAVELVTTFLYT
jgi:tRNA dimethylallyltransferase